MLTIDKFIGNVQDKFSSKSVIKDFLFDFDTQENNLEFAYYCIRYHLRYLMEVHVNNVLSDNDKVNVGKIFGFHYHLKETNEWYYFEVSIDSKDDIDVQDFIEKKINPPIRMTSSTKVVDEDEIEFLNSVIL